MNDAEGTTPAIAPEGNRVAASLLTAQISVYLCSVAVSLRSRRH